MQGNTLKEVGAGKSEKTTLMGGKNNKTIARGGRATPARVAGQSKKSFCCRRLRAPKRRSKQGAKRTAKQKFFFPFGQKRGEGGAGLAPPAQTNEVRQFPRPSPSEWGPFFFIIILGAFVFANAKTFKRGEATNPLPQRGGGGIKGGRGELH